MSETLRGIFYVLLGNVSPLYAPPIHVRRYDGGADYEVRGKALNAVLSAMEIFRDEFFDFLGITLDVFAKRYIVESP